MKMETKTNVIAFIFTAVFLIAFFYYLYHSTNEYTSKLNVYTASCESNGYTVPEGATDRETEAGRVKCITFVNGEKKEIWVEE